MSSNVVNEADKYYKNPQVLGESTHLNKINMGMNSEEITEDYTSYRIIEMLKQDKFMKSLDTLNHIQKHSSKRRKLSESQNGEFEIPAPINEDLLVSKDESEHHDGCSLISENIELPKYDESKNYYIEYWKTFMDIKIARDELMQCADKRNEKIREVLKIMKYYDSNYEDLKENKPNGRKKHNRRTAKEIAKEFK